MKNYYFITAICILLFCSQCIQAQKFAYTKAEIYLLKKDFTQAKTVNEATYILQIIKYSDTNYTCRYYNKFGPMVKQETFLDSSLSIPNGVFMWYDNNGNLDSSATVYRGHKTALESYDDDIKPIVYIRYRDGKIFEKRDHLLNIYVDSVGNTRDLAEMEKEKEDQYKQYFKDSSKHNIPASFNGDDGEWKKYLSKHLLITDRFEKSMPPGRYYATVSFLIKKDGKVDEVTLLHSVEWSEDLEVFKVFENSPPWQPAVQNGKNVIYRQKENIDLSISEQ